MASFQPKRPGNRLPLAEFEKLEEYYANRHQHQKIRDLYDKTYIEAVAHIDFPPYSLFALDDEVQRLPLPRLNTKIGFGLMLCTNGRENIPSGSTFIPEFITTQKPVKLRVSAAVQPGIPIGCSETEPIADIDFSSGLVAVTNTVDDHAYCLRMTRYWSSLAKITSTVSTYGFRMLGVGKAYLMDSPTVESVNPATGTAPWEEDVYSTHLCDVAVDTIIQVDSMLHVGLCLNHPEYEDE